MELREFLDAVLAFIGSESLTDEEFGGVGDIEAEYDKYTYAAMDSVLEARESVSSTRDKLRYTFLAKGADLDAAPVGKTNIFLGAAL